MASTKEVMVVDLDCKLNELEVQKTTNLGNMTNTLLMMATAMDAFTRCASHLLTLPSL